MQHIYSSPFLYTQCASTSTILTAMCMRKLWLDKNGHMLPTRQMYALQVVKQVFHGIVWNCMLAKWSQVVSIYVIMRPGDVLNEFL